MADDTSPRSSGVEALIERLRQEGITRGQAEAQRIVDNADARAKWLVEQAQLEAEQIREEARRDAERLDEASRQALEVAARDAVLQLKSALAGLFREELQHQVERELGDPELLRRLILELVGRLRPVIEGASTVEVLLPSHAADIDELRHNPDELASGALTQLTRRIAREMLRDGVTLAAGDDVRAGFRLRLRGGVELEFTDQTVTDLLRAHLHPRFRAMLDGIVK